MDTNTNTNDLRLGNAQAALSDEQIDSVRDYHFCYGAVHGALGKRYWCNTEEVRTFARAILATRQPAPVASAPAFPPSRCLFIAGDEPTVFNGIALDAGQRLYVLDGEPVAPQPAAAPVAADVARGEAVLQSLLDEAREDNARLKAKLVIATTKPTADAAPVDAKPVGEIALQYIDAVAKTLAETYGFTRDQCADVVAVMADTRISDTAHPSTAQGDALSQEVGEIKTSDEAEALYDLRKAVTDGASDEWLLGFIRQYPFAQRAASQDSERDAALLTTRTMDGWNFIEPTHTAAEDMRDAARYRWLRDVGDETWKPMAQRVTAGGIGIDAAIDAAMAAQQGVKGGA